MRMINGNRGFCRRIGRIPAGLAGTVLLVCSCRMQPHPTAPDALLYHQAETALAAQDYDTALRVYQEVQQQYPGSEYGDDAQFKIGFLYICHKNPQVHYDKALNAFRELVKDYPQSIWVYEASSWIKVLESRQELQAKAEQVLKAPPPEAGTEQLKEVQRHLQEMNKSVDKLTAEKKALIDENEKLKSVLKKLEAIDR